MTKIKIDPQILNKQIINIRFQGPLVKQSRYIKRWKKRWVVLTPHYLMTFKEEMVYKDPTEVIQIKNIVKASEAKQKCCKGIFRVATRDNVYNFYTQYQGIGSAWVNAIGRHIVNSTSQVYNN